MCLEKTCFLQGFSTCFLSCCEGRRISRRQKSDKPGRLGRYGVLGSASAKERSGRERLRGESRMRSTTRARPRPKSKAEGKPRNAVSMALLERIRASKAMKQGDRQRRCVGVCVTSVARRQGPRQRRGLGHPTSLSWVPDGTRASRF